MKQFNKFMTYTLIICFVSLIVSTITFITYISSHKIQLEQIVNTEFNINLADYNFNFPWSFKSSKNSSLFETIKEKKSEEFDSCDELFITTSKDKIMFIEENRNNIKIDYYTEKPNTALYKTFYEVKQTNNKIYITSTYSTYNLVTDINYDSYVKVYVPLNYKFNKLVLDSSLLTITNESIYDNVDSLIINANIGDINIEINKPKDILYIDSHLGNVYLTSNAPIKSLENRVHMGMATFKLNKTIDTLTCNNKMGNINILSYDVLNSINLNAGMGDIKCSFKEHVNDLNVVNSLGNIKANFYKNQDSTAYIDVNIGDFNSDLPITNNKAFADLFFNAKSGSVNIKLK
jgi:hypothetical protein